MFQKGVFPKNVITYIGENHILMEVITVGVMFILFIILLIQISKIKKEIRQICRQVRKYLDVVFSEDVEEETAAAEEEEDTRKVAEIQEIHTYQRKKEQESSGKSQNSVEEELQNQRDAQLLMDVISDVF